MKLKKEFPSVVKYMGSKTEVLDLIEKGFNFLQRDYDNVCDLFAGSATLSGALRNEAKVISNDVQMYSSVFANTYLNNYNWDTYPDIEEICAKVESRVRKFNDYFSQYNERFSYNRNFTLEELNALEEEQRDLVRKSDWDKFDKYYLFVKNYSGTYWSYDQCIWIDSFRCVIDEYKADAAYFNLLLACLIYAMAYNSQSTGHYAQYRIPENDSSKEDILIYRRKSVVDFFVRKYYELRNYLQEPNSYDFETCSLKDVECLNIIPERSLVYADPPYCFVHYSRFYHVLETLVRYDYPEVKYKGRYRTDRYQSNYCIKTEVIEAFCNMFEGIRKSHSDLVLSYTNSNTNTVDFRSLLRACCEKFNPGKCSDGVIAQSLKRCESFFREPKLELVNVVNPEDVVDLQYQITMIKKPYNHSRMGRKNTKTIPVTEVVIIAKCLYV